MGDWDTPIDLEPNWDPNCPNVRFRVRNVNCGSALQLYVIEPVTFRYFASSSFDVRSGEPWCCTNSRTSGPEDLVPLNPNGQSVLENRRRRGPPTHALPLCPNAHLLRREVQHPTMIWARKRTFQSLFPGALHPLRGVSCMAGVTAHVVALAIAVAVSIVTFPFQLALATYLGNTLVAIATELYDELAENATVRDVFVASDAMQAAIRAREKQRKLSSIVRFGSAPRVGSPDPRVRSLPRHRPPPT